jgi:hypothetical protein
MIGATEGRRVRQQGVRPALRLCAQRLSNIPCLIIATDAKNLTEMLAASARCLVLFFVHLRVAVRGRTAAS